MDYPVSRWWPPGRGIAARVLAILVFLLPARAAVSATSNYGSDPPPRHVVQAYIPFNNRDLALGAEYMYRPRSRLCLAPFAFFGIRPDHEVVKERLRPRFAILYREVRYHGGAGVQAMTTVGAGVLVHAGLGGAYSFGDYAGTGVAPESGWTPLLRAGFGWEPVSRKLLFQVSYQYADLKSGGSSWCVVRAGVVF